MICREHDFNDYLKLLAECPSWKGHLSPDQVMADGRDTCTCLIEGGFFYSIIFIIDSLLQYCSWPQLSPCACVQRQQPGLDKARQASHQADGRHEGSAILVHVTDRVRREAVFHSEESGLSELWAWGWAPSTWCQGRELRQRGRGKGLSFLGYPFIHLANIYIEHMCSALSPSQTLPEPGEFLRTI